MVEHIAAYIAVVLAFMLGITIAGASGTSTPNGNYCDVSIHGSGISYNLSAASSCKAYNITYANNVSNANIYCKSLGLSSSSSIYMQGNNYNDRIYNCSFANPAIELGTHSSLDIIGSNNPIFNPLFSGPYSNVTVGYFLTVNVYEPSGYNSTREWGTQLTHYSYILPTINNTFPINNTQLQMVSSFSSSIANLIGALKAKTPFGLYNETNSTIYLSTPKATSYGTIYGSKTYALPSYTVNATSTRFYSPYNVEYSFFAYDQLIMFKVNMSSNMNITPLYIQPIFPPFNFRYVPNANNGMFTIRWLLSVPPQDRNWTFNYHIYRYNSMQGFTVNPFNTSISQYASFVNLLTFPPASNTQQQNQSKTYIFNYTSKLGIGLNSSITIANGTAYGGKVSYIQDSTTPSFSQGIGYCSSIFNETNPSEIVNESGYYKMVSGALQPLGGPALPILYTAPCAVGAYIRGNSINIICNNSIINDTGIGIEINDSSNVNILYCDIKGNGIFINNSTNVSISNTGITPGLVNSTGISIISSRNVKFVNDRVYSGFSMPFNESNSSGMEFYNLSSNNMSTISYIQNRSIVNGEFVSGNESVLPTTIPQSGPQPFRFSQRDYLYISAAAVLVIYIYLFLKIQYKPSRHGARHMGSGRKNRTMRKRSARRKRT